MEVLHETLWSNCLEIIKDNLGSKLSYETWFKPIKPVKVENDILTIQVPSPFYYEYIETHYIDLLSKALRKVLGANAKLEYKVIMEQPAHAETQPTAIQLPGKNATNLKNKIFHQPSYITDTNIIKNPFIIPGIKNLNIDSQLNPNYSFSNFVEGECNRLARAAGYTVAQNIGKTNYNPLFIYSKPGLGKSHLVQAIGIEIKEKYPKKTVLYVDADTFQRQFAEAAIKNERNDFMHFYQMIDVLIIDDVQYLAGKERTQKAFFQIFNYLHQKNKQIILTSDCPPVELQGLEERLLSRFKWGLSTELKVPDFETRLEILKRKTYNDGIEIQDEILEYIANHITTNIRELEGVLISILAQSTINNKQITLDLAKDIVEKLVKNTQQDISIDFIKKTVCDYFNIGIDQLKSKTRKREIVQSRQVAMFFAKSYTKNSLASIGAQIGGKDHATVLHACKTVNNLMETDKRFKRYIQDIEKRFKLQ
ncbi:MAG: Chromosomal replication initiator protein DnaA [Bacteroidetes bacterium ADurb.Bin217]|nr:MAG: Chromosomal replication initiator protein DnaA [Bacteroidetes bacterium ADurb.Bin217]HOS83986.1 chromosomal replication initiator protein DnaA [Bacteroidales bacterium]